MNKMKENRRKRTINRLIKQLSDGTKIDKNLENPHVDPMIPLTDSDKVRIKKELETLKSRV